MEFSSFGGVGVLGRILPGEAIPRVEFEPALAIVHLRMRSLCWRCVDNLRRMQGWGLSQLNSSCASSARERRHKVRIAVSLGRLVNTRRKESSRWLTERTNKEESWSLLPVEECRTAKSRNAAQPKMGDAVEGLASSLLAGMLTFASKITEIGQTCTLVFLT